MHWGRLPRLGASPPFQVSKTQPAAAAAPPRWLARRRWRGSCWWARPGRGTVQGERPKAGAGGPALREVILGADFNADDLLAVQEPVLVRGFDPATLAAAKHQWSPEKLRQTQLFSATAGMTGGRKSQTRVMRYREQLEPALDSKFGFEWPAHKYDNWDFHSATLENTLDPPTRGTYEMFAKSVADLGKAGVHPEGVGALYELIQPVCIRLPKNIKKMKISGCKAGASGNICTSILVRMSFST